MRANLYPLLACLALALAGCAAPKPAAPSIELPPFNEGQARALMQAGNNSVKGSAVIRQNGGGAVTCAGAPVYLVPLTDYARTRFQTLYGNDERGFRPAYMPPSKLDPQQVSLYQLYMHVSRCDAQGFFAFKNVADGEFVVATAVVWMNGKQGGTLMQRVRLSEGRTVEVVLSP